MMARLVREGTQEHDTVSDVVTPFHNRVRFVEVCAYRFGRYTALAHMVNRRVILHNVRVRRSGDVHCDRGVLLSDWLDGMDRSSIRLATIAIVLGLTSLAVTAWRFVL